MRGPLGLRRSVLLGGLATISPMATDMYLSEFPHIADALGVGSTAVQATLTAYLLPFALCQLFFGALSDAHGRRPFVIGGSVLLVLGSVVCALAPTATLLLAGRVLQGLGGAAASVSGRAMVADLLEGRRAARAYIAMGTVSALGPIVAPTLGASIGAVADWRAIFFAIGLTQLGLLVLALSVAETLPPERRTTRAVRTLGPRLAGLAGNAAFRWRLLVTAAGSVGLFAYISGSPFVAEEIGLSTPHYALDFATNGLAMLVTSVVCTWLVVRVGREAIMWSGLWLSLLGAAALCLAALEVAVVPAVLFGFLCVCGSRGALGGTSFSYAADAAPGAAGLALAAMGTTQFGAGAVAAVLIGVGDGPAVVPVAIVISLAVLVSMAAHTMASRRAAEHRQLEGHPRVQAKA
ncbi:Bcr/CflA family efflux MFS transporter [Nocardioides sp.]|uniref:Bcr/CflA family efflux MFS transporter n=1 Tax=Nocardioides sp. TaxID=35761 RepID=UPI0039E3EEDF